MSILHARRRLVVAVAAVLAVLGAGAPLPSAQAAAGAADVRAADAADVHAAAWPDFDAAGEHTLIVVPAYWTAPDAQTTTTLRALARSTGDYWSEQTNGAMSIPDAKITVHDWVPIADPGGCDRDTIFYAARDAAGVHEEGRYHTHVLVYFPHTDSCPWDGMATVGPEGNIFDHTYGWIWINGYPSADVWEREFAHTLSLGHASGATCHGDGGVQVPLSGTCDVRDRQDHDLMGEARGGEGHTLNAALADRIGLLPPAALGTASQGSSFTLAPIGTHHGLQAVKVLLSTSILYVEYRPRTGRDAGEPPGWDGVQVRQRNTWDYSSRVLALRPDGADGSLANVAAPVGGDGWRIPGTTMRLIVDSQDVTGAAIRFAAPPDDSPPPAVETPTVRGSATQSGDALRDGVLGGDLSVSWPSLEDPESGIAAYRVYVDGELAISAGPATLRAWPDPPSPGAHVVRVDVVNGAGLTATGVDAGFVWGTAPAAPGVPTVSATSQGTAYAGTVSLTWAAVDDPAVTGYDVYVDDVAVASVGAATTGYEVGELATGGHNVRVVAVAASGLGAAGPAVTFAVDASPPPAPSAPSVTGVATARGFLRGPLAITWAAVVDPDSSVAAYRVVVDGAVVATPAFAGMPVSAPVPASGAHAVRVDAVNEAGLVSTGATATVQVDAVGPVIGAPVVTLRPGAVGAGIPVTIFATSTDAGSGACGLTVAVDGRVVARAAGATLRVATVLAARRSAVQVTARDCVGTTTVRTTSVPVVLVQESSARYGTGWVGRRAAAYAGGAERRSGRAGARATYTFTGSSVAWLGSREATTGVATVLLDGRRVAVVDTWGRTTHRQLLWAGSTRYGRHTVTIVVNGTRGRPTVAVDGFVALG